jgi:hypothetical protein
MVIKGRIPRIYHSGCEEEEEEDDVEEVEGRRRM